MNEFKTDFTGIKARSQEVPMMSSGSLEDSTERDWGMDHWDQFSLRKLRLTCACLQQLIVVYNSVEEIQRPFISSQ